MKKDLHPKEYRYVVVQDTSNGDSFLTRSTAPTDETIKWEDGNEYPLVKVHISSTSHPFYTGKEKLVDIEGRVDKFKARREAGIKRQAELKNKTPKPSLKKTPKEDSAALKIGDTTNKVNRPSKPAAKKSPPPTTQVTKKIEPETSKAEEKARES